MDQTIVRLNHAFGLSTPIIWMVVIGEILVGLGLIFGVWTRVAGLGGVIIMAGAVYFTHGQNMSAIEVLCAAFILMLIGGGAYAVTHCKCNKACCAVK
jgi:putative oxidoreductase